MIRKLRLVGLLLIAALSLACNTQPATCDELPLTSDTTEQLAAASTAVGFAPQLPCVYRNDLEVARIFDDSVGSAPRINFLVLRRGERRDLRDGERIFIFSQTRGEVPFHAIPRSTHNIAITATTVAGDTIAYLRWRTDGITHELAAILTHWFDELTALHTAAALIATR